MKNTRLIKVIETFSKSDLKKLKEFVHSPFFRASKTERDLFDFIYINMMIPLLSRYNLAFSN